MKVCSQWAKADHSMSDLFQYGFVSFEIAVVFSQEIQSSSQCIDNDLTEIQDPNAWKGEI